MTPNAEAAANHIGEWPETPDFFFKPSTVNTTTVNIHGPVVGPITIHGDAHQDLIISAENNPADWVAAAFMALRDYVTETGKRLDDAEAVLKAMEIEAARDTPSLPLLGGLKNAFTNLIGDIGAGAAGGVLSEIILAGGKWPTG
jgi:hypothetical protein